MRAAFIAAILALAGCVAGPERADTQLAEPAIAVVEEVLPAPPHADQPGLTESDPETAALLKQANFAEAMQKVEERQLVFDKASDRVELTGNFAQGGLVFGKTERGARARLDGADVMVDDEGRFVVGFGRDAPLSALLAVTLPDGAVERISMKIDDREFPVQRIVGLDQSKVSGFTEEQLAQIAADTEKKKAARAETQKFADWAGGFDWPARGPISGVFGSQRILNGEPKRPHSGLDVAAPAGSPVHAPADGVVRLAEPDMYFEGGLILLDHGQWLESAFMHLSRLDVAVGQHVRKGELIGAVGATGRATGPHLHWSLKWMGELVDPQLLVPSQDSAAPAAAAPARE